MIRFDELPVEDRLLFLELLVNGNIDPQAQNKYLFSMVTGKKYRIEVIDGQYYFEPCDIGYDKVNIKEDKKICDIYNSIIEN